MIPREVPQQRLDLDTLLTTEIDSVIICCRRGSLNLLKAITFVFQ